MRELLLSLPTPALAVVQGEQGWPREAHSIVLIGFGDQRARLTGFARVRYAAPMRLNAVFSFDLVRCTGEFVGMVSLREKSKALLDCRVACWYAQIWQ